MDFPEEVVAATEAAESFLLAQPGVTAVGLGMREQDGEFFDELSVRVYLAEIGQIPVGLPEQIGGVGVCFVAGDIRPCGGPDVNRFVGLSGGIQITSVKGAGTLGAIVEDIASGTPLGLTCFHVVAAPGEIPPFTVWQPTSPPLIAFPPSPRADVIGEMVRFEFPRTPTPSFPPQTAGLVDAAVIDVTEGQSHGSGFSRAAVGDAPGQPNFVGAVTVTATPTVRPIRPEAGQPDSGHLRDSDRWWDQKAGGLAGSAVTVLMVTSVIPVRSTRPGTPSSSHTITSIGVESISITSPGAATATCANLPAGRTSGACSQIRAPEAWDRQTDRQDGQGTNPVNITVIDSGCDKNHPDLARQLPFIEFAYAESPLTQAYS